MTLIRLLQHLWDFLDRSRLGRAIRALVQSATLLLIFWLLNVITSFFVNLTVSDEDLRELASRATQLIVLFAQLTAVATGAWIVSVDCLYAAIKAAKSR